MFDIGTISRQFSVADDKYLKKKIEYEVKLNHCIDPIFF